MSKGASFDYQFGTKKNWRRWIWNRIAERVDDRRNAICIYLPSADDKDRQVAIEKGFRSENLIGVERNRATLGKARQHGLCVHGEFFDAVFSLQRSRKIAVIFGDFCSGLSDQVVDNLLNLWLLPNTRDAVCAFNFLRGRDGSFSAGRDVYQVFRKEVEREGGKNFDSFEKHRGAQLFVHGMGMNTVAHSNQLHIRERGNASETDFNSYRSSCGQVFDSVVTKRPFDIYGLDDRKLNVAFEAQSELCSKTARSVAAILAHRTMRLQAA